jgi:hypothetical protein
LVIDGAMWQRRLFSHLTIDRELATLCNWPVGRILLTQIGRTAPPHEQLEGAVRHMCPKAARRAGAMVLVHRGTRDRARSSHERAPRRLRASGRARGGLAARRRRDRSGTEDDRARSSMKGSWVTGSRRCGDSLVTGRPSGDPRSGEDTLIDTGADRVVGHPCHRPIRPSGDYGEPRMAGGARRDTVAWMSSEIT